MHLKEIRSSSFCSASSIHLHYVFIFFYILIVLIHLYTSSLCISVVEVPKKSAVQLAREARAQEDLPMDWDTVFDKAVPGL